MSFTRKVNKATMDVMESYFEGYKLDCLFELCPEDGPDRWDVRKNGVQLLIEGNTFEALWEDCREQIRDLGENALRCLVHGGALDVTPIAAKAKMMMDVQIRLGRLCDDLDDARSKAFWELARKRKESEWQE